MNINKKPYEISLWDDRLVWHRRKLEPVNITSEDYKPGKFYSRNESVNESGSSGATGAAVFILDINGWNEETSYYKLTSPVNGNYLEDNSAEAVSIDPVQNSDWYSFAATEDKTENSQKKYYVSEDGVYKEAYGEFNSAWLEAAAVPNVLFQYYKEVKIATIGSDTMDSPARCVNPKLSRKINGENTLTFTIYYRYWDDELQDFVNNPFTNLLVNERKVKLRLGDEDNTKWLDFVIKSVQENSETKAFAYTCKDQFVNELSKSGFEIVLDNELENNMGTIDQIAESVLDGTDWIVDDKNTDQLLQYIEEPVYRVTLGETIYPTSVDSGDPYKNGIAADSDIYVFYSNVVDKEKPQWQFLYDWQSQGGANDDLVIDKKCVNYIVDVEYDEDGYATIVKKNDDGKPMMDLTHGYRGNRLVKQAQTKYDSKIDKFVKVYNDGEIYGFEETEYVSSGAIVNHVANPNSFISTSGWQTDANHLDYKIKTWPERALEQGEIYQSFIEVDFTNKENALVMNSGIGGNRSAIEEFVVGEKYVLRMKYKSTLEGEYMTAAPTAKICEYHLDDNSGRYVTEHEIEGVDTYKIFEFSPTALSTDEITDLPKLTNDLREKLNDQNEGTGEYEYFIPPNYIYMLATCSRSVSKAELTNWDFKVGLFFDFKTNGTVYIEDVQVFPYETYDDGVERLCVPGGKLHSEIKTKYVYYNKLSESDAVSSIKDLKPIYSEYQPGEYTPYYESGSAFTKVRSISAKESNRYNILQDLCETFECWMRINVPHELDGSLTLDDNFRPIKKINFRENVGRKNPIGFRYGVNSKSIQRTVDSAAVVSKMVVKDNANEFAPSGFCSIARAPDNPTGENFLLNFDHYVRHKLLDFGMLTNDLYLKDVNGHLGYYTRLKELNRDRNNKIDLQAGYRKDLMNFDASYTTYKSSYDNAVSEQLIIERDFSKLVGWDAVPDDFADEASKLANAENASDELKNYWNKWCQYQNVIVQHKPLYEKAEKGKTESQNLYDGVTVYLKELTEEKRRLWLEFYKKYSRFIQEGSWIKEDYVDPNLYYLDAESTLHTSTQPKVTYNISVIDVAPLANQEGYEDFAYYDFDIGDMTYIEDVEFFGWSLKNRNAPYREEIVVSEITTELDAPEKNQIKVQNYKTQFEDLFQRITAQTQQAEYHTGEYARAASIVQTDGTIAPTTLENSFANNAFKLANARDQSVVWDSSGITTTSLANPSEMVRIISGGIFLSVDGGQNWKTGVTGRGINTSYLTAGQINTNEIYIMNGKNAAFRWDNLGLAAYYPVTDTSGNITQYNTNKFVRFDHNGIYGCNDGNWSTEDVEDIYDNAPFSLTWKGFSLKNDNNSVRISTTDDIQAGSVSNGSFSERVKIGRLSGSEEEGYVYGIRISDAGKNAVMETDNEGKLWLKNELLVGTENTSTVKLGYLTDTRPNDDTVHEVIHAGSNESNFIVYEDGFVKAENVDIKGVINATGGQIGNMTIEAVEKAAYEVRITSDKGLSMKEGTQVTLTATLYLGGEPYNGVESLSYKWYKGGLEFGSDSQTLTDEINFNDGFAQYSCEITIQSNSSDTTTGG